MAWIAGPGRGTDVEAAGTALRDPSRGSTTTPTWRAVVDELRRRAAVRHRHRVPPRAHVLPPLALVQLAWPGGIALVDPLGGRPAPLAPAVRESDAVAVAARRPAGPRRARATPSAAIPPAHLRHPGRGRFVGYAHAVAGRAGAGRARRHAGQGRPAHRLAAPAAHRRPADVRRRRRAYLLELQDRSTPSWPRSAASAWVDDACEELRTRPTGGDRPRRTPGLRLKDARTLRPTLAGRRPGAWRRGASGEAQATRHRRCARCCPTSPSSASPSASRRRSTSWPSARGVDERHRRGRIGQRDRSPPSRDGQDAEPPPVADGGDELDRALRPAVTLVSAWVSQVARDERIDTALLATRADLVALLRGDPRRPACATAGAPSCSATASRRLVDGSGRLTSTARADCA